MDGEAPIRPGLRAEGAADRGGDSRARCADALEQLRFFKQRSVIMVRNVLKSAMTNADEGEADMQRLFVSEARVDGGPYYRRFRPKDRGRAHPIAKKTSHIIVTVAER